ncbi:MAG TPA: D-glycerate dehydrogenase [Nevskiaceae bacterium]|nr:D-glycerate dehydrogenase [Nevskiaceae bacterium]
MATTNRPRLWLSRPTFDDVVATLEPHFELTAEAQERQFSSAEVNARLRACDAAMAGFTDRIGEAELAGATRLRFVANLGVGFDNLDLKALTAHGIGASNTPGVLDNSVADFTWALMLAAARRVGATERWVRNGKWRAPSGFLNWLGQDVSGHTLGILGMGRIGRAVARRAVGFGMPVLYHNRSKLDAAVERELNARWVDQATLLRDADVLVLLVPRTPQTHHLVGAAELALMKPTAVLVNVARGGIVDEAALAQALGTGRLAAAGLDVFEHEPVIHPALLELDNVVLSPHAASATVDTRRAMARTAADNLLAFFGFGPHAGQPPNLLNPEVLQLPPAKRS